MNSKRSFFHNPFTSKRRKNLLPTPRLTPDQNQNLLFFEKSVKISALRPSRKYDSIYDMSKLASHGLIPTDGLAGKESRTNLKEIFMWQRPPIFT